ncbi:uncharacterized protein E5676_scaffold7742G00010 [Cucumis melo var. makuwa]|uniref:Uncharacterized protein n=1 Tax=Cucumis melo var. makuwa TaxID=1194695 RepID=A0A5D3C7J4_CUCMM|nr:uncharacterized protein E5676_scaffold7742G00010 [Cucumis melo var. makuwa]
MDAMFLEFEDDLDNIVEGSSSVGDNMGESKNFLHFNCVIIDLLSRIFFSTTCDSDFQETCVVSTLGVRAPCCNKWAHSDDDRPWRGEAYFLTRRSLQLGDRRLLSIRCSRSFKSSRPTIIDILVDCHKKYSDPKEARVSPPNALVERLRIDTSSATTI